MAYPPHADTLAGAVTGAVAGVVGVQSWYHTLAPTCLSPRHLPWPWKACSSTLVQPISRDARKPALPALSPTVSRLLPFYHFIFGATLPTCALAQSCHPQSTCFVLVTLSCPPGLVFDMQVIPPGWEGADNRYLTFIALPRGPHVADSLPRTKNLDILICVMRDIPPRAHLVAVAEGPAPWIQVIMMMNTSFCYRPRQLKAAYPLTCIHDRHHGTHGIVRTP